ncbi:MAG TPA: TIGR02594 family protein [Pirellulales bacterium]|nr:TIGR02594 family protein [Pirellulales bacterium]
MSRWDQTYRSLDPNTRASLDQLVNAIFRDQTGYTGKIDPKTQPQYVAGWIEIRDDVLANRQKFAEWLRPVVAAVQNFARALPLYDLLDTTPSWIQTARRELGTHAAAGTQLNPRIMQYILTCTNIQQTDAQRRYVAREGEHGVEWCSAFVNWCLGQAGIVGTQNALAASWSNWGTRLTEPKQGAVVTFSWGNGRHIDHVAFCDDVNDQWRMLGGNQTGQGGQVSSVTFPRNNVVDYRWPPNA